MFAAKNVQAATTVDAEPECAVPVPQAVTPSEVVPRISVVITWPHSAESLREMLRARAGRGGAWTPDTIVVTTACVDRAISAAFPDIRFVIAPADAGAGRMRRIGIQEAIGDVVMLMDADRDHLADDGMAVDIGDATYPGVWRMSAVQRDGGALEHAHDMAAEIA